MWLLAAFGSAIFAGITSILAKCGIKKTDSDTATFIRTFVVLIFSWIMAGLSGSLNSIILIDNKSFIFLILSGMATGFSWICYFKALALGDINKVVPVDKMSTILSVLAAIFIFQETDYLLIKLLSIIIFGTGIVLMIEKKNNIKDTINKNYKKNNRWFIYAVLSAVFAALTSLLAKAGIENVESNLATAIRTAVVLFMSFIIICIKGKQNYIRTADKKEVKFIILSGFATGASWLCYYYAVQNGVLSVVIPIDKMSILITVIFSYIIFKERLTKKSLTGLIFMVTGTLLLVLCT